MQIDAENLTTVAHVIQLAVAPVFLLMAIGGLLGVLTGRLGRLVDRFLLSAGCERPAHFIFALGQRFPSSKDKSSHGRS